MHLIIVYLFKIFQLPNPFISETLILFLFSIEKSKALSLVLHCCDISHPSKKWDLHHKWTLLLMEEFFLQVISQTIIT